MTVQKTSTRSREFSDSVIDTIREPLIILDQDLRVVTASRSFYEFFKVKPDETEGQLIYNLGNDQWDIPKLRELLETILPEKTTFDNYEVEHDFATIGKRVMLLNARQIKRALGKEKIILLAIEDITERKQLESLLIDYEEQYRRLFETASDGIVLLEKREGKITQANPATEKLLGYSEKESVGNKLQDIGVVLDTSDFRTTMQNLNKSGIINYRDVKVETKSGQNKDTEIYLVDRAKLVQCNIRDITEHKKTEKALWESEENYRLSFENVADVIYVMDTNLNVLSVSPSVERILGYKPQDFIGRPASDLSHIFTPESFEQAITDINLILKGGTITAQNYRFIAKDGSIKIGEVSGSPVMRDDKIVGLISVARDITDRNQAEEKLRESEEKFRWMLDNMADVIAVMDMNLRFTYVSPSIRRMRGYTAEEAVAQTMEQVMTPESLQIVAKVLEEEMKLEASGTADPARIRVVELEQYKKDGSIVCMDNSLSFMRDEAQKPVGIISVSRDITERKRAEEILRQQTDAMDAAIDGMAILNAEGEYIYINKAQSKIYGYDNIVELIGKSWKILYDSDVLQYFDQEIMPEFSRKGYWYGEAIGMKKNGSKFPQELSLTAMANGGLICVVRDITDRKQAEQECQLSEERFRRIFDEGPFGMGLESPDQTIIAVNKVLCELLGYTEQELIGKNIAQITSEEDREKSKELLGQLFANTISVIRSEKRYIKKNGDILWAHTTISAVHGQDGNMLYGLAIIEDLTESRKAAEKIHLLAYYDSLTGLPNRTFHKELIKRSIEHAQRHKEIFAIIYIGLDNFHRINDTLGHSTGDLLLKAVAGRLTESLRQSDYIARPAEHETVNVVSRVSGDEFIVLAHDLNQAEDAAKTSRRLLEEMSAPYDLNGHEVFLTISIGISLYPDDGTDVDNLLKNAEKAMRHTKSEGRNNFHFYSSSMHTSVLAVLTMESDLHKALERNELVLYYQPKVDATTRMVKGMEALIRWIHPDKGMISPMQFIPLAEASGLIIPIGEFVIRTVCRQIKTWQDAGYKQIAISLNVSGIQFDKQNLIEIVKDALQDTMIPSQCLELEITESLLMRNPEKTIRILTELEEMGIGILIDDFGTGYSSLSYLKRLPALDFLKIDQSFVQGLASDSRDQAIVKATIAMAHSLNLKTIAEGVETQEQLSFLQEHGCDEIQGYLFSKPLPAKDIPALLAKGYL